MSAFRDNMIVDITRALRAAFPDRAERIVGVIEQWIRFQCPRPDCQLPIAGSGSLCTAHRREDNRAWHVERQAAQERRRRFIRANKIPPMPLGHRRGCRCDVAACVAHREARMDRHTRWLLLISEEAVAPPAESPK